MEEQEQNKRWITVLLVIGNIIIWSIIMLFIAIAKVDAASINYDSTGHYVKVGNNFQSVQRNTNTNITGAVNQINIQYQGYQTGAANGVVVIQISSTINNLLSCNTSNATYIGNFIRLQQNGQTINSIMTIRNCTSNISTLNVEIGFLANVTSGTGNYLEFQLINMGGILNPTIRIYGVLQVNTSSNLTPEDLNTQTIQILNGVTNNIQNVLNNQNSIAEQQHDDAMDILDKLQHSTPWEERTANISDFEDYEDAEDILNEYTDVDFNSVQIDLDPDTNNWVWNTLTSLINTNRLVFGMVISILSIGIIKLILNR